MNTVERTRLLLLEDDAVSAAFLRQALAGVPAAVDHACTVAAARAMAGHGHDLWLFDARLPDGHGAGLLRELRQAGWHTPALALTADDDPRVLLALREAGFAEVLAKPVAAAELLAAVRTRLESDTGPSRWDDAAALSALGGNEAAMHKLRQLFLQELPGQFRQVQAARVRGDGTAAHEQLHRLKAGCGFVGARALLAAVRELSARPGDDQAWRQFDAEAAALMESGGVPTSG